MMYTKRIVCLANSRKTSGRCLAGKEINANQFGAWVRPVSDRPTRELSEEDRRYKNGQDPKLLDIIRVPLTMPEPHSFQTENHLIDDNYYWVKEGTASVSDLRTALDPNVAPLWNDTSSSYNGEHDRVSEEVAATLGYSLKLIQVQDLTVEVNVEGAEFGNGKRKVRGRFSLGTTSYKLAITDPNIERQYLAGPEGIFNIGNAILCISLGEPYGGFAYKLIAAVII